MLYAKAAAHNSRCTFVEYPTGKHMDTWLAGGDHYWRTILQFLEQNVPENKGSGTFSFRIFGIPTIESPHSPITHCIARAVSSFVHQTFLLGQCQYRDVESFAKGYFRFGCQMFLEILISIC